MAKILFNVSDAEKQLWVETATRERLTLSEWLRRAANAQVGAPQGWAKQELAETAREVERPVKSLVSPRPEREFKPDFKQEKQPKGRR